eukprot:Gb_39976 [translate_table: standard]
MVYTDTSGRRNQEYISLGCDTLPLLKGRSPIQVYADCMKSFSDTFSDFLGKVIVEIQVGMGPYGELSGVNLSGKVAGIHWHYCTRSHAAELTAGYYNTRETDGYIPIARLFSKHGVVLNFTCFEMKDSEQPQHARCSPEGLLKQVTLAARKADVALAGENALARYDETAYTQIIEKSNLKLRDSNPMCAFTYLRMNQQLFQSENWRRFVWFVRNMSEGRTLRHGEEEHHQTELKFNASKSLRNDAAALMHA